MAENEDYSQIPLEQRITHKSWKARVSAYEEITATKDSRFLNTISQEKNQIALEAGLQAILKCLETSSNGVKPTIKEVVNSLGSGRSITKDRSMSILIQYCRYEGAGYVAECLFSALDHKTPKNVVGAEFALKEVLFNFGLDFDYKSVIKKLPALFEHKDKNVRVQAVQLTCEFYRWIGSKLVNALKDLKPVQLKELEEMFSIIEVGAKPAMAKIGQELEELSETEETPTLSQEKITQVVEPEEDIDICDPVSFIDKIPNSFYSDSNSTKWKERKEALESLVKVIEHPKLEDGKYHELVNVLAKKMQDPNVVVLNLALQATKLLAIGLGSNFGQYRNIIFSSVLMRLKEKKPALVNALKETLDSIFLSIKSIAPLLEDILAGLDHQNPNIRGETLEFISRCLAVPKAKNQLQKAELKQLAEKCVKLMDDGTASIRDSAANALSAMIKEYKQSTMDKFMSGMDSIKLQKVMDLVGTNVANPALEKKMPKSSSTLAKSNSTVFYTPTGGSPEISRPIIKPKTKKVATKKMEQPVQKQVAAAVIKYEFDDQSAFDYVSELLGPERINGLTDSNWKIRLETILALQEMLQNDSDKTEAWVRFILNKIVVTEKNFQVMTIAVKCLSSLIIPGKFGAGCVVLVIDGLCEKLGDMKVKKLVASCFDQCVICADIATVLDSMYSAMKSIKGPKILADCLSWINSTLVEFGVNGLDLKKLSQFITNMLDNSNQLVRQNAIILICTLKQFGKDIRSQLQDLNPSLLKSIETELEKVAGKSLKPNREPEITANSGPKLSSSSELQTHDFCNDITQELFKMSEDKNWKERKQALEEILQIVQRCQTPFAPQLSSEFIQLLKLRISDSNKSLALIAVDLCRSVANGMGKPFEKYTRLFAGLVIAHLSDLKAVVRQRATQAIDAFAASGGIGPLIQPLATALMQDQPQIRKELLKWIYDAKENIDQVADVAQLLHPVLQCLQDRNSDVRKLANQLLEFCGEELGSKECRMKAAEYYKGAQFTSLVPFLDGLGADEGTAPAAELAKKSDVKKKAISKGKVEAKPVKGGSKMQKSASEVSEVHGESGDLLKSIGSKESRAFADKGMNKWSFDQPRKDLLELLSDQCKISFRPDLHSLLFSEDHYKEKDFLQGLTMLENYFNDGNSSGAVANCDLILKYLTIRFFDTNTSVFKKTLDLLSIFFQILDGASYTLCEYEAQIFLPFFIAKLGDPKDVMRIKLRGIVKSIGRIYPVSKLFLYLLKGMDTKNSRTKAECLDELSFLINRNGASVFVPSKSVLTIASQIGDRDNNIRQSALNCVVAIYGVIGDEMFEYLNKLGEKERDMIQEKLKRQPVMKPLAKSIIKEKSRTVPEVKNKPTNSTVSAPSAQVGKKQFSLDLDQFDFNLGATAAMPAVSDDLETKINEIIIELAGFDTERILESVRQLEKLIIANPGLEYIKSKDLVGVITPLLNSSINTLTPEDALSSRLCRHYVSVLVNIVGDAKNCLLVPQNSLEELVRKILIRLVDTELQFLDPTKALSRALNMLMVRIIDGGIPNSTFKILLKILRESTLKRVLEMDHESEIKYTELAMKCLWKITKVLPQYFKEDRINVLELLDDINLFLEEAPPSYWKRQVQESGNSQSDMPLRTVKTILHELVGLMGENIVNLIDSESYTGTYLQQMLQSLNKKKQKVKTPIKHIPSAELDEIFKQIADKEETKTGLKRLHELLKEIPSLQADVDKRIEKTGTYFQGYIRRGLLALKEQPNSPQKIGGMGGAIVDHDYNKSLENLQNRFKNIAVDSPRSVQKLPIPAEVLEDNSRNQAVQELKERLARMKQSMNSLQ